MIYVKKQESMTHTHKKSKQSVEIIPKETSQK